MNYLEDFLNNKSYKSMLLMFSFIMIFFTDFYKNNAYEFDTTNTTLIYQYNTTDIDKCNYTLKLMHDYKINNIFTYSIILFLLGFMDFTLFIQKKFLYYFVFNINYEFYIC